MNPTVSVIVPTHNRPETLDLALASLAAQEGVEVEAIVVNDAGPDVSPVVARWSDQLEVRLINQPRNRGLSAARNRGIEAATSDLMAFLDDDDVYLPEHLKNLVAARKASGADIAYASCPVSEWRVDPVTTTREEIDSIPVVFDFDVEAAPGILHVANPIPVHSALVPSLRGIGARFDTNLPVQEDWDMWLRLEVQHGMKFVHVDELTVIYHRPRKFASMTTDANSGGNSVFYEGHLRLMQRWPVLADSPAAVYRPYILESYGMGTSGPVSHFRYEDSLREIYKAMAGITGRAGLHDRIAAAIRGDVLTER